MNKRLNNEAQNKNRTYKKKRQIHSRICRFFVCGID